MRFFHWLRQLWHREAPDDRWWEDGRPVELNVHVYKKLGVFQLVMMRETNSAEYSMTIDMHRQIWGEGQGKELEGIEGLFR